jgi:hypothetical protein
MKNRIVSIALVLCLLAAVFVALPTKGAIDYTGGVRTMDITGQQKVAFFEGDALYVNVTLMNMGTLVNQGIRVELQSTDGTWTYDTIYGNTNRPVTGYYNSTIVPRNWLDVPYISGPMAVFNIVAYHDASDTVLEIVPITVRELALRMMPAFGPYYPGEEVTITWTTTYSTTLFYMHIINETGVTKVNWSRESTTVDGWWSAVWNIDPNMADGNYRLRARSEATHATLSPTLNFQVQKYSLSVQPDRDPTWPYNPHYLPGETAKLNYLVYETATFMPYPGVSITYSSSWLNTSGNMTWLNGTLTGDSGIQEFLVPTDIALYSDIDIVYWANESSRSDSLSLVLYIDQLFATLAVNAGPYRPGDMVLATVTVKVGPDVVSGATVNVKVERNGTDITSYGADNLTTDLQGQARHTFTLVDASAQDGYVVTAVVTKAGYSVTKKASFYVTWGGSLTVQFDKLYYFSGDTASVSFKAVWNNQMIVDPSIGYQVYSASGLLSTGNTTGQDITVAIPDDYYGSLTVSAQANYNGNLLSGSDGAQVYFAMIVLTPSVTSYSPGDTVTFNYEVVTGLSSASMSYKIRDSALVNVAAGDLTGMSGSFEFEVPLLHPSSSYRADVTLTDSAGRYASADSTVWIVADFELKIWSGKSGYTSGEFKPGQTIKVHYSITSYLTEDRPVYVIVVSDDWSNSNTIYQVTESSGVLSYKLPVDTPKGELEISAVLWDGVLEDELSDDGTKVVVNDQLSGWDRSVAGMSASDFIILVLIIVMILLLIVMPFLKGRMGAPKAPKPEPVPPAPEAPKTP